MYKNFWGKKPVKLCLFASFLLGAMLLSTSCRSGVNGEVYVYSYGDYFDPMLMEDFEEETGVRVILDTYDTAEEMYTVLENNATTYDVIVTSDYMVEKMINNDMLAELDYENIPKAENIGAIYMQKSEAFDPGNKYSIPYQVGTAGIMYNTEMVGDVKIDSWNDLWNEKFSNQLVMPDSVREAFMIGLMKQGYSLNSTSENEIKSAAGELIAQKQYVYRYANDAARDLLADGSAAVGVVWNGEYIYTKDLNPNVEFVIPEEGTEFFIDSWVIPKKAINKEHAEAWINFMCKAKVASKNFEYLYYTTPNEAAKKYIDEKYLKNESIFPSDETLEKCQSLRTLDNDTMDLYSKYWKKVKAE